jgi:Cft2 family RNA processing exonuclease
MPLTPHFDNGIHLSDADVWLDAHEPRAVSVVSHAHSDHVRAHERVLSTNVTASMMRLRGLVTCRFETLGYGETVELDTHTRLTLYPAGHILGSAQALIEWEGERLLYSGDFKMRAGKTAEPIQVPAADCVIMETTFGIPRYRLPSTDAVLEDLHRFCREALRDGRPPVLFCYSLGKGQEILAALEGLDAPIYLHTDHWQMAALYARFGVRLPAFQRFQPGQRLNGVLICAFGCRRAAWFARLGRVRTAYLSGWAMDPGARFRFRTDAAFPLSDHADYDELLEYVSRTGTRRVHTVHGFAEQFAQELRRRGLWAEPLRAPSPQLSLFDGVEA